MPEVTQQPLFSAREERTAVVREGGITMGDKRKGKDSGKDRKSKTAKVGHRPHEERQREALKKAAM